MLLNSQIIHQNYLSLFSDLRFGAPPDFMLLIVFSSTFIKIFPIKSTVKKAVAYITNPDKTDEQKLVSSFGVLPKLLSWNLPWPQKWEKIMSWKIKKYIKNNIRQSTGYMILPFRNCFLILPLLFRKCITCTHSIDTSFWDHYTICTHDKRTKAGA